MLKLTNLSHSYGDHAVVNRVTLTLAPSQRLALMGPSGCGKTTLLRIALGLLKPAEGKVENTFLRPSVVFQEPRLLPWNTALENVNLVLSDDKTTISKAKNCLEMVELDDAAGKYPRELSGGMQQRVALARALAMEGDLLVLDEPFKGLDGELRLKMLELVNRTHAAILLVTHDEEEAKTLGCRIIQM